jgi:hypothetical protein
MLKNLQDKLKEKKVSDISINFYLKNLQRLNNGDFTNLNFLSDIPKIKEKIAKYKPNTQRSYFISIVSVLSVVPNKQTLYKKYYKLMMDMNHDLKKEEKKNIKSESQIKNWESWTAILERYNKLKDEVLSIKKKTLDKNEYEKILMYVVSSLYILNPPRRNKDYQLMNIISNVPKDGLNKDINYLDLKKEQFIFNNYKTKKNLDTQIFDINPELMKVIKLYMKYYPNQDKKKKEFDIPFLVNFDNKPFTHSNNITYLLNKLFDKKISSSMLRHIYLSEKYGNLKKEMADDSTKMAHSAQQQQDYIKK